MFHLAQSIYEQFTLQQVYSILILGLDNAGKTTLLETLKEMYLPNYQKLKPGRILPTVGQNIATLEINQTALKFWDVGGQDSLRELWTEYYEQCHAIIFVIDSADLERLMECKETLAHIISSEKLKNNQDHFGVPILMLANKQDLLASLPEAPSVSEIKEIFNKIAADLNALDSNVKPVSATSGEGIKEAIEWIQTRVVLNRHEKPPKPVKRK